MRRVLTIGSPGSGKSTLARELAKRTGLPLVHLDTEYWHPGWVETAADSWAERIDELVQRDSWIIDGNYGGSLRQRLAAADTVILLDYPTRVCLWRILLRWRAFRGQSRPDMPENCPERLDMKFLYYVLMFRTGKRPRNEVLLANFSGELLRFTSPVQLARWLAAEKFPLNSA